MDQQKHQRWYKKNETQYKRTQQRNQNKDIPINKKSINNKAHDQIMHKQIKIKFRNSKQKTERERERELQGSYEEELET